MMSVDIYFIIIFTSIEIAESTDILLIGNTDNWFILSRVS